MILADYRFPRRLRPALAQAARVLCPAEIETLGLVEHVVDYVELQLRAFPAGFRVGMVAGLAMIETAAALRPKSLGTPFSALAPDDARAWFRGFWNSRIGAFRQLARALKALVSLAFYDSAPMRDRLGYHPDAWIAEAARKRLATWGGDIRRHEEAIAAPDPLLSPSSLLRRLRHA
jgi:hypothetical protein